MGSTPKNKWIIGIKKHKNLFNTKGFHILKSPVGEYWADPFLFDYENETYLFFEKYNYDKGVIACGKFEEGKPFTPEVILKEEHHLSFPFVFEAEGKIYMIPETGASDIKLYKSVSFPNKWEYVKTIGKGAFGDTVVYRNNKEWLLFTTQSGDSNLVIMRTENIEGDWDIIFQESILNSRNAGKIFEYQGKLIRPVQVFKPYGFGIIFKSIQFAPYREKEIHRINPDWLPNLTGCHTFNFNRKYVVIDARYKL